MYIVWRRKNVTFMVKNSVRNQENVWQVTVKLFTKIWSIVTGYNAFLRITSRSLAVLASFDLQTGSNFVQWSAPREWVARYAYASPWHDIRNKIRLHFQEIKNIFYAFLLRVSVVYLWTWQCHECTIPYFLTCTFPFCPPFPYFLLTFTEFQSYSMVKIKYPKTSIFA